MMKRKYKMRYYFHSYVDKVLEIEQKEVLDVEEVDRIANLQRHGGDDITNEEILVNVISDGYDQLEEE
jgi:hypothetical protein